MRVLQTKLVHDPTGFDPIWSPPSIEHQCLPHPYNFTGCRVVDCSVLPSGLPVPRLGGTISPRTSGILAVSEAEEVPTIGA